MPALSPSDLAQLPKAAIVLPVPERPLRSIPRRTVPILTNLSEREAFVFLTYLECGSSSRKAAARLGCSRPTVSRVVRSVAGIFGRSFRRTLAQAEQRKDTMQAV